MVQNTQCPWKMYTHFIHLFCMFSSVQFNSIPLLECFPTAKSLWQANTNIYIYIKRHGSMQTLLVHCEIFFRVTNVQNHATGVNVLSSLFISRGCVPGNRDLNRKDINWKLLDTVMYLSFATKFSFSFQIWHIYIYKEMTYIELKQFITKSGHKKSQDVNQNDVYWKDL
jgi:hypothetical protein